MRKDGWDSFTKRELILNSLNLVDGYRNKRIKTKSYRNQARNKSGV